MKITLKHKKTITSVAFFLFCLGGLQAQESPTVSGGEASGSGGTVSYSIGQVVYTTATGTNGSLAQGVQQPYEISSIVGIIETSINLELSIFPNPTTNYLTLKTVGNDNLSYQLHNTQGQLIEAKIVSSHSTNISLERQPTATYFLKVVNNNEVVKTFKIIKN